MKKSNTIIYNFFPKIENNLELVKTVSRSLFFGFYLERWVILAFSSSVSHFLFYFI